MQVDCNALCEVSVALEAKLDINVIVFSVRKIVTVGRIVFVAFSSRNCRYCVIENRTEPVVL